MCPQSMPQQQHWYPCGFSVHPCRSLVSQPGFAHQESKPHTKQHCCAVLCNGQAGLNGSGAMHIKNSDAWGTTWLSDTAGMWGPFYTVFFKCIPGKHDCAVNESLILASVSMYNACR